MTIDKKYKLPSTENSDPDDPFDKDIFDGVMASSKVIRKGAKHRQSGENIKKAQKKQRRDYESDNKSSASNSIYTGGEVLLTNNKRKD